jgi:hypothetical protein
VPWFRRLSPGAIGVGCIMAKRNALIRKMPADPAAILATALAKERRRLLAQLERDWVALGAIERMMDEVF